MASSRTMRVVVVGLICTLLSFPVKSADIVATGGWTRTIDDGDLISGPGSDLADEYISAANSTVLDVTAVADYRVDVRRTDSNWHGDFTLSIQRTSDGSGSGSISGGTTYQAVTTADASLFTGNSDRTGIDAQYKLNGMSVSVAPDNYTTIATFTIVDL